MAKGRVTPKGQKIVYSDLIERQDAQDAQESTRESMSMIERPENLNTAQAMLDASNERSRTEQRVQSADALQQRDALVEKLKHTVAEETYIVQDELTGHLHMVQIDPNSSLTHQEALQSTLKRGTTMTQAENQNLTATTLATQNAHFCDTPGCIAHKTRIVTVGTDSFQFRVHFTPTAKLTAEENLLEHATESVSRKVAHGIRLRREKKKDDGFPSGRVVDIDSSVNFARTLEDEKNDILRMSQEQRERYLAELMRRIEMAKSLQSV